MQQNLLQGRGHTLSQQLQIVSDLLCGVTNHQCKAQQKLMDLVTC
uniref:Uncharacterized protein n=1 Tax=Setaria italica TaxID=4555 RepID=K4AP61_SETIT